MNYICLSVSWCIIARVPTLDSAFFFYQIQSRALLKLSFEPFSHKRHTPVWRRSARNRIPRTTATGCWAHARRRSRRRPTAQPWLARGNRTGTRGRAHRKNAGPRSATVGLRTLRSFGRSRRTAIQTPRRPSTGRSLYAADLKRGGTRMFKDRGIAKCRIPRWTPINMSLWLLHKVF